MTRRIFLPTLLLLGLTSSGMAAFGVEEAEEKVSPEHPNNLNASGKYEGATTVVTLNWVDRSNNETGFEVLRSDNAGEFRVVGLVGANTTRYIDKIGKYTTGAFTYAGRALNQYGKSDASNKASVWF